jgi:hypothetical protein
MDGALVCLVWQRAGHCCEYCRMPQDFDESTCSLSSTSTIRSASNSAAGLLMRASFRRWCESVRVERHRREWVVQRNVVALVVGDLGQLVPAGRRGHELSGPASATCATPTVWRMTAARHP